MGDPFRIDVPALSNGRRRLGFPNPVFHVEHPFAPFHVERRDRH